MTATLATTTDWNQVQIIQHTLSQKRTTKSLAAAINAARRQGAPIVSKPKRGAGTNRQHAPIKSTTSIDRETEIVKYKHVSLKLALLIQKGRQIKGLSQKDLAAKICEKIQVVKDYESGRGISNNCILAKMEKVLGLKLRGKDIGQPLVNSSSSSPSSSNPLQSAQICKK